jgi:hypothetical protein
VAEFDKLFAAALRGMARPQPTLLRLTLDGAVASATRELVVREADCCPLFGFALTRTPDGLQLDIQVPAGQTRALDELAARARAVAGSWPA